MSSARAKPSPAQIDEANREVVRRIGGAQAVLVDLLPAHKVIPAIGENDFLHAGPPLAGWQEACAPLQGAVIATLIHEGRARNAAEAIAEAERIRLVSAAEFGVAATFGGVITRSTNVFVVENEKFGTYGYAAINEGRGKALRYGSYDEQTLAKYGWLEGEFADILGKAIRASGGIDLLAILRQCLNMGDEGHSRQKAASALFANQIAPYIVTAGATPEQGSRALRFLGENEIFFLSLTMATGRAAMRAAEGVPNSTVVTNMAANGVDWGIQVSGAGRTWFTAPVPPLQGMYFDGYTNADASPVIGDSEVAETMGLGAFALASAPALARYMGGTVAAAMELSLQMYEITVAEHPTLKIGPLEFRGSPCGVDTRLAVRKKIAPVFNSGIAHREAGIGQIGAGYGYVPMKCCEDAVRSVENGG